MNNQCDNCGNPYLTEAWEAALAERDKRIAELDEEIAILRKFNRELIDRLFERMEEIGRLRKAFSLCHDWHRDAYTCARLVDKYYHELFPDAHNPHKNEEAERE